MDFFGIGAGELLLILALALIIWGPGKLPEIARTLGRTVRAFRKATFDLTNAVTREIEGQENTLKATQSKENADDKTGPPADSVTKLKSTQIAQIKEGRQQHD